MTFLFPLLPPRARSLLLMLAALSCLVVSPLQAEEARASDANAKSAQVVRMVLGIVSYARWPAPQAAYRLCVTPEAGHLRALFDKPASSGERPLQPILFNAIAGPSLADCDILYIGNMAGGARQQLLDEAIGKPVLTISEGDEVCTAGSMFCLALAGAAVGLQLNLDAISRSGIRINPKVLQLAIRKPGHP